MTTPLTTPPTTEAPSYSPPSYASIPDSSICDELRAQLNAGVDSAVGDAQNNVDDIISQHPELAPYAGQAKQDLQNAAPQARAELEQALRENGC